MSITLMLILAVATSFMLIQARTNNGDIRLVDSRNNRTGNGRVEIFLNESWGTICVKNSPRASIQAVANTACRQLQFIGADYFGTVKRWNYNVASASTPIHIGSIICPSDSVCSKDSPLHVLRCRVDQNVAHTTCTHDDDIVVSCTDAVRTIEWSPYYNSQVALCPIRSNVHVVDVSLSSGVVCISFNYSTEPKPLCGIDLDENVANTACRQLGYTNARSSKAVSNTSKMTVWDAGLNCKSQSHSCLSSCFSKKPTTHTGCNSIIIVSCEFDLSLKNANPSGSPLQCDAKYCKRNSHTITTKQSFSLPGIITVIVIIVIVAACATCLALPIICCLVPGCLFYRKRRSDNNDYKLDQYQKWAPSAAQELLITNK